MLELDLDMPAADPFADRAAGLSRGGDAASRLRLIVVDADPLARRGVVDALRLDGRFVVVAQADGELDGVELALHYRPELVVVAAVGDGADAVETIERITSTAPEVRAVLLSATEDLELEMNAVRAGASGFLRRSQGAASIAHSLILVARGESVISREMTSHLLARLRRTPADGNGLRPVKSTLTDREWEILDLICSGASTRDMADELVLSTETVNSHVKRILRKLGVHSRSDAVDIAGQMRSEIFV
ncbi:MAG: response regulator transcription factor [Solirubrobacteraceae bacterium]|jgi:two-component system nitrate/nitrite response regulator NarL